MSKMQKNTRLINLILCFGVALLAIVLDQITKLIVVNNMKIGQSVDVIKGVFRFTYITNSGSAFGMLAGSRWVFMILSTVGILAICVYTALYAKELKILTALSFGMVIGGGIGNMIDRTFNGEVIFDGVVVDFLDFCAFPDLWKWIFNVADAFVCVGVALLIISLVSEEVKNFKARKNGAAVNTEEPTEKEEPQSNEEEA